MLDDLKTAESSIHVIRSFPEALHLAKELAEDSQSNVSSDDYIKCWVAGGERLYNEALLHPSASQMHLTVVHVDVDTGSNEAIARFPAKYRWDNRFAQVSREEKQSRTGLTFEHYLFERIKGTR